MFKKVGVLAGVIGIVLGLFNQVFAAEVSQEWKQVITDYYIEASKPGSNTWRSWEIGIQNQYTFNLRKLDFEIEFLNQKDLNSGVSVGIVMTIKAYCLDSDETKRKVESVRGIVLLIDKESKKVLGGIVVMRMPTIVTPGWNNLSDV